MLMSRLFWRFLNNIRAMFVLACLVTVAHAQQQVGVVSGRVVLDGKTSTSIEVVLLTEGNERRTEIARAPTDAEANKDGMEVQLQPCQKVIHRLHR